MTESVDIIAVITTDHHIMSSISFFLDKIQAQKYIDHQRSQGNTFPMRMETHSVMKYSSIHKSAIEKNIDWATQQ
jgi:hypothetical protein